jgi:rod shape-determining protein MreD
MSLNAARPLNPWRWLMLPALTVVGATYLFAAPLQVFGLQLPEPVFAMVPAFAWAVIRPSVLAPFGVLLLGVFLDLFWGGPLGLWGLSLLGAYAVALTMRSMMTGQSLPMMWAWFGAATGVAMLGGYLFSMLDSLAMPSMLAVFWQFLATVVLFPFAHRLIDRFEDADVRFR